MREADLRFAVEGGVGRVAFGAADFEAAALEDRFGVEVFLAWRRLALEAAALDELVPEALARDDLVVDAFAFDAAATRLPFAAGLVRRLTRVFVAIGPSYVRVGRAARVVGSPWG